MTKALVVLSGGQDSTTCAVMACSRSMEVAAITFDYGQRHSRELLAAKRIAFLLGITNHEVLTVGPILNGTSPLTDSKQPLETYENYAQMEAIIGDRVEKTFVPMRNALFLTLAANRAACMDATDIYTGVCQADNANYPDCRASFIRGQQATINEALGYWVEHDGRHPKYIQISTPLMNMSKAESVRTLHSFGLEMFTLLAFSHTAYDGAYPPVGRDHASTLRAHGFEEAGLPDPLIVRACMESKLRDLPLTGNYQVLGDIPAYIQRHKDKLAAAGMSTGQDD